MEYSIEKAIPILERVPYVLKQLLLGLDKGWVMNNEGGDSWSPYDIIGHYTHGERTDWMVRIKLTLEDNNNEYTPFDRYAQLENSKGKTLEQLLDEFIDARAENITELKALNITDADLNKTGIHSVFGKVTLKQLLSTWVAHDLGHIAQIARVMTKQYKDEVGPWKEYLSIMHDREK